MEMEKKLRIQTALRNQDSNITKHMTSRVDMTGRHPNVTDAFRAAREEGRLDFWYKGNQESTRYQTETEDDHVETMAKKAKAFIEKEAAEQGAMGAPMGEPMMEIKKNELTTIILEEMESLLSEIDAKAGIIGDELPPKYERALRRYIQDRASSDGYGGGYMSVDPDDRTDPFVKSARDKFFRSFLKHCKENPNDKDCKERREKVDKAKAVRRAKYTPKQRQKIARTKNRKKSGGFRVRDLVPSFLRFEENISHDEITTMILEEMDAVLEEGRRERLAKKYGCAEMKGRTFRMRRASWKRFRKAYKLKKSQWPHEAFPAYSVKDSEGKPDDAASFKKFYDEVRKNRCAYIALGGRRKKMNHRGYPFDFKFGNQHSDAYTYLNPATRTGGKVKVDDKTVDQLATVGSEVETDVSTSHPNARKTRFFTDPVAYQLATYEKYSRRGEKHKRQIEEYLEKLKGIEAKMKTLVQRREDYFGSSWPEGHKEKKQYDTLLKQGKGIKKILELARKGQKLSGQVAQSAAASAKTAGKASEVVQKLKALKFKWLKALDAKRTTLAKWRPVQKAIDRAITDAKMNPDLAAKALSDPAMQPPKDEGAKDMARVLELQQNIEAAEELLSKGTEQPPGSGKFNPITDKAMRRKIRKGLRKMKKEYYAWRRS